MPVGRFDIEGFMSEERQKEARRSGSAAFFKWQGGGGSTTVWWRVLPPWATGVKKPWKDLARHVLVDEEGNRNFYLCLQSLGQDCPACALVNERQAASLLLDRFVAKDCQRNVRYYYNVLAFTVDVLNNTITPYVHNASRMPRVFIADMTAAFHRKLKAVFAGIGDITDPETGWLIRVTRASNGETELTPQGAPCALPGEMRFLLENPAITDLNGPRAEAGDGLYNLESILVVPSAAEIQQATIRKMSLGENGLSKWAKMDYQSERQKMVAPSLVQIPAQPGQAVGPMSFQMPVGTFTGMPSPITKTPSVGSPATPVPAMQFPFRPTPAVPVAPGAVRPSVGGPLVPPGVPALAVPISSLVTDIDQFTGEMDSFEKQLLGGKGKA